MSPRAATRFGPLLGLALAGCAAPRHGRVPWRRVVDLTHPLSPSNPSWPSEKSLPFERFPLTSLDADGYASGGYRTAEHFGTHLDAPAHFAAGEATVERIPPERLVGPGVRLDLPEGRGPDGALAVEDVLDFETAHGRIPRGAIVLLRTGWSARWADSAAYRNSDAGGTMRFPGFGADAARFLVVDRGVAGLGIDTLSIDAGSSPDFGAHKAAARAGVYGLENLRSLEEVPPVGSWIVVAPIAIAGGSGGQARVFALLP